MSSVLEVRAEIIKLARTLAVDPSTLEYLDGVPAADLRRLREQTSDRFFAGDRDRLGRAAAASRLIPNAIAAPLAQRALGPMLCARIAGLMEPSRAVDIARRLSPAYLADIAIEIDPRQAATVIARVPKEIVADVAAIATERGEAVTMGRFVGFLDDATLRAAIERIDDASLLRVAFVMEAKDRLEELVGLLPDARISGVLRAAHDEHLWPEALDLISRLSPELQGTLGARAADLGLLPDLVRTAHEQHLWADVLPVVPHLSPSARDEVGRLAADLEPALLDDLLNAATQHDLWSVLVPLAASHSDRSGRARIGAAVAAADAAVVTSLADAVQTHGMWGQLLEIAGGTDPQQVETIADRLLNDEIEARLPAVLQAADEGDLWQPAFDILAGLSPALQARIADRSHLLDPGQQTRCTEQARAHGGLDRLGALGEALAA